MEVIETANAAVLTKFRRGMREVKQVNSIDVTKDMLSKRAVRLTCEDRRLSIGRMGESFYSIDVSTSSVYNIEPNTFEFMLNVSAAMLDLDATHPQQKSFKKIKHEVMMTDGFKYGRVLLESKL